MIKVGNQTNSQDPQAVNSRVFVGNLNTFQANKVDVERLFQRYGRIAGISMHKGFAFVQFTNPLDARSACMGEDARGIFGQVLDVNMVAEPKPTLAIRKRQHQNHKHGSSSSGTSPHNFHLTSNTSDTANDNSRPCSPQVDVNCADKSGMCAAERCCDDSMDVVKSSGKLSSTELPGTEHRSVICLDNLKTYSSPDVLICGQCRELFGDVMDMIDHKRSACKLRFVCKCSQTAPLQESGRVHISCALCRDVFTSGWDMMVHFQTAHTVNIYRLGTAPPSSHSPASGGSAGQSEERTESMERCDSVTACDGLVASQSPPSRTCNVNVNNAALCNNNSSSVLTVDSK